LRRDDHLSGEDTYLVARIRGGKRRRQLVSVGAPDRALTPNAGMAAISELCDRLGVIGALVGPVKQRARGFAAGQLLTGIAAAQLAGEDFLAGLDRHRADAAGQLLTPVSGLAPATAAGVARRVTGAQWLAVETGLAAVTERMLGLLPAARAAALTEGPVTTGLDATDVEACGSKERGWLTTIRGSGTGGRMWRRGPRRRSCWPLTRGPGTGDPRATAPDLLRRALAALPERVRAGGRVPLRADAGYFAGALARAAYDEHISFAIGAKRIAPLRRLPAASARTTGATPLTWTMPRSRWRRTARTGGPPPPGC
jgi:hypothetical protein